MEKYLRLTAGRLCLVSAISTALIVAGCQTNNQFASQLGAAPLAADDVCASNSEDLRNAKGYFERSLIAGAIGGAVTGALLGAVLGDKNRGRSALAGAAVGVAGGLALSYYSAKQQESRDRAQLVGTIRTDVRNETAEIARALAAFQQVRACRLATAASIKSQFRQGALSRQVAQEKLNVERKRYADDVLIAEAIGAKLAKRHKDLQSATVEISRGNQGAMQLLREGADNAEQAATWTPPNSEPARLAGQALVRATTNVNIRATPSLSGAKLGLLKGGASAKVIENSGGWTKVQVANGNVGYVASKYLSLVNTWDVQDLIQQASTATAPEEETVVALYEGVEKRIELERLTQIAKEEEKTSFTLL